MNMTTPTNEEVRRQFEAWARGDGYSLAKHRTEDDWYVSHETQAASDGYQAALSSPAVVALVEALKLGAAVELMFVALTADGRIDCREPWAMDMCEAFQRFQDTRTPALAPFTTGAGHE